MTKERLGSIDGLRGLVMVIMALDHVRWMLSAPLPGGFDFSNVDAPLFFTRWISHLCAPTFIFLAGVSAFLYGAAGRSKRDVSYFLVTRGIWLVFIEVTVVNFGWNFNVGPDYVPFLQVIWAIGISMIVLGGLVWLPRPVIAGAGLVMILGHNLLDAVQPTAGNAPALWLLLHVKGKIAFGGVSIRVLYPLIPWIGVMAVGYAVGPVFTGVRPERPRRLVQVGLLLVLAFAVLRLLNLYGDANTWHVHETFDATVVDVLDATKYPPSLHYLLMTLGPAFMLLGAFELMHGKVAAWLVVIGRVPFFFYILHIYVIHGVAIAVGVIQGFSIAQIAVEFELYPPEFGVNLGVVYLFWIGIVLALYPACAWFAGVKARRRDRWLSYL